MAGQNHKIYVLNYLKVSLRVLRIFCSYYHEPSEPLWYTVYSIILVCFLIVIPGVLNVIKVIKCLLTSREFDMLSRGTTNMAYVTEVYCFITQKQYVSQVLMDMDSDIFEPRNGHQANLIERQLLKGKLFNVINMWVTCVLCFLYGIKPLVSGNFERVLPMNVWYPINTTISPAFEIIYAYEFTFMMLHACTHAGLASIPIITMSFLIGQLNVIADTLQNLKKYAEEDVNTDNKEDKMMKTHAEMKKLLVQCVCKHRALRR